MAGGAKRTGSGNTWRPLLNLGGLVLIGLVVWRIADVLLLLFGGVIFATALRTLAGPFVHYLRVSPRVAILVVVLVVAMAIAVFVSLVAIAWVSTSRTCASGCRMQSALLPAGCVRIPAGNHSSRC